MHRPNAPDILLALARAKLAANEVDGANRCYERVTQIDPRNAEAWFGLGITDRASAEMQWKKKSDANTANERAAQAKARWLLVASETAIQKGLQIEPDSVAARMLFAESFRIAERYSDAVREYQEILKQQPASAPAWAGLAAAYSAAGETEKAVEAAWHAVRLDPNDSESNVLLAGVYMRAGDYANAQPYAEHAVAIQPDSLNANLVLGKLYLAQNELAKALPSLRRATREDTSGAASYLLATTLSKLGQRDEAAAAFKRYRELHSESRP